MAKTKEGLDEVQVKSSEDVRQEAVIAAKAEAAVEPTDVSKAVSVEEFGGTVRVRW